MSTELNPYEYYSEFQSNPYTTESAYGDIGVTPSQRFLGEEAVDAQGRKLGLTYADLIPQYDSFAEDRLRSQFQEGTRGMYSSSVGELAGITSQASMRSAQSGFAGGGAIQSALTDASSALRRGYSDAFSGSLLDLTSGIRSQRMGYQEDLANLLADFQGRTDYDIYQEPISAGNYEGARSYGAGEQFGNTNFSFPADANLRNGQTVKAPDGNTYVFMDGEWILQTGTSAGGSSRGDIGEGGYTGGSEGEGSGTGVTRTGMGGP